MAAVCKGMPFCRPVFLPSLLGTRGLREAEEWGPCWGTRGKRAAAASEAALGQLQVILWVPASISETSQWDSYRQAPPPAGQEETQGPCLGPHPTVLWLGCCCSWPLYWGDWVGFLLLLAASVCAPELPRKKKRSVAAQIVQREKGAQMLGGEKGFGSEGS